MIVEDKVTLGNTAIPYVAVLEGALRGGGLWEGETWMLAGLTGLAFQLVVDPKTCPSSPTAYAWAEVHASAADRIGIRSSTVECIGDESQFAGRQEEALGLVRQSLDRGQPAVVRTVDWAEFAVVVGYDDEDGVLFFDGRHSDPVLYANFGRPEGFPFLFAQTFEAGAGLDVESAARSSLEYAVLSWRGTGFPKHPWYDFAVGEAAYAALIDAVDSGGTDPLGLRYILKIHADARQCLAQYTARLVEGVQLQALKPAAMAYAEVAPLTARAAELLPCIPPFERPVEKGAAKEAGRLLRKAASLEATAIGEIEAALH